MAGVALTARVLARSLREVQKRAASLPKSPMFTSYYKGGFDKKTESQILGRRTNRRLLLAFIERLYDTSACVSNTDACAILYLFGRNKSVVREGEDKRGSQEDNVIKSS